MDLAELRFWIAVGLVAIVSVAIFKVLAAHGPAGLQHLAGAV
ncbi:MAG TPA: hypothetical protein VJ818_08600 [Actinomycetota bacterium]|nr:hypothetical protein [Actinomycetota bacterium]